MTDSSSLKKQAGSIAMLAVGVRTLSQIMSLALLLVAGRILTVELFGVFALAVILLYLAQVLLYSGIYNFVLKEPDITPSIGTAFSLQWLIAAGFSFVILLAGGLAYTLSSSGILAPLIISTAPLPLISVIACWQEAVVLRDGKVKPYYACMALAEVTGFAVGIWLLYAGYGVWALIISRYVMTTLLSVTLCFVGGSWPKLEYKRAEAKRIMAYSGGLYGNSALTFFNAYWSDIMIGAFLNARAVGLFRMGTRMSAAAFDVFAQTTRVLGWQVVGRQAREGRMAEPIWVRMFAAVFMIMLAALGSMAVLGEELTVLVLGDEWLAMVPILQLVCVVRILGSFDLVATAHLAAAEETNFLFRARFFEAIVLAVTLAIAVKYGALAVAFGLLPSAIFLFVVLMHRTCRTTGTSFGYVLQQITPALLIGGVTILTTLAVKEFTSLPPIQTLLAASAAGLVAGALSAFTIFGGWMRALMQSLSEQMLPAEATLPRTPDVD